VSTADIKERRRKGKQNFISRGGGRKRPISMIAYIALNKQGSQTSPIGKEAVF
jgi:hypothetical protein